MTYAALARELGAEILVFGNTRKAVLWYAAQKLRRKTRGIALDGVGAMPRSQASVDSALATYSRMVPCFESERDAADLDNEFCLYGRRVEHLIDWYVMGVERGQQSLADRLGMTLCELSKYAGFTENVLRRRLESRGLLG